MDQRLEQLEIKLAFVEQANAQLSEVVFRQQQAIDALREEIHSLAGRLAASQSQPTAYTAEEEKPPHY